MKKIVVTCLLGLMPFSAIAGLRCNDTNCDVKWKTGLGDIDLSSVCYNYKGKPEYSECRKLAADVFRQRCERARASNNDVWNEIYCDQAMNKYHP